jgi:ABC-2 type transport system permease protein
MRTLISFLYCELLKIYKSRIFIGTIIAFSLAPIMGALFVVVLRSPALSESNSFLETKAAFTGFSPDWPSYLNLIAQAIGIGGIIIFGFISSWTFGREYSDRTAKDLLVLPVPRFSIVLSKMLAIFIWCVFLIIFIFVLGLLIGSVLQLPDWSPGNFMFSLRAIAITSILVILLNTPVTFVASIGKGYLAPLAFVILAVVLAQIIGALGLGTYFPWAVPAIYSKIIGTNSILNFYSYLILIIMSILGFAGTYYTWAYMDQTK